jgi:dolichol-phosphate mannosyltransferase
MPLYNEEESIRRTVCEWLEELRTHEGIRFDLMLIDDGSKDGSLSIIRELALSNQELIVVSRANRGHGRSCIEGYSFAYENGYDLVMQLDSDGQCDPKYFHSFLDAMNSGMYESVYGIRYYRKDGFLRYAISRVLSVVAFIRTGAWVFDPNVPYRLFKTSTLSGPMQEPQEINLYNVYLALHHRRHSVVKYIPIVFRDRWGGSPSVKVGGLWKWGMEFWREFGKIKV